MSTRLSVVVTPWLKSLRDLPPPRTRRFPIKIPAGFHSFPSVEIYYIFIKFHGEIPAGFHTVGESLRDSIHPPPGNIIIINLIIIFFYY